MNIKKQVYVSIVKKLEKEQQNLRYEIRRNKQEMSGIVDRQTRCKRELVKLQELINSLL